MRNRKDIPMYDVVIIGAGVSGCAVARELSRYEVKAVVLEKALDVCEEPPRPTAALSMPDMMPVRGALRQN